MVKKFGTVGKKLLNRILSGDLDYQGTHDKYAYYTLPEWKNSCMVRVLSGVTYADSDSLPRESTADLDGQICNPPRYRDLPGSLKYLVNSVERSRKGYLVYAEEDPIYKPLGKGGTYVKAFRDMKGNLMSFGMNNKIYQYLCAEESLIYYYPDVRCFVIQATESSPWSILVMPVFGFID